MQTRPLLHHLLRLLLPLALTAASCALRAAPDYNVELILFKYTRDNTFASEHWPTTWPVPDTAGALDLDRLPRERRDSFRRLESGERTLADIAGLLNKSDRYEVLAYETWRQPGLKKDDAVEILVQAGQKYDKETPTAPVFNEHGREQAPETQALLLRRSDVEPGFAGRVRPGDGPVTETYRRISAGSHADPGRTVYELEGTVTLVLSRFLHIYTDLLYRQPVTLNLVREPGPDGKPVTDETTASTPELGVQQNAAPRYRVRAAGKNEAFDTLQGVHIHRHRRMRSGELHHLDHPLVGMIVKVTPAKND